MAGEVAGFLSKILQSRVRLSKFCCTVENEPTVKETKAGVEYQLLGTLEDETDRIRFIPSPVVLNQRGIPCVLQHNSPVSVFSLRAQEEETSAGFLDG